MVNMSSDNSNHQEIKKVVRDLIPQLKGVAFTSRFIKSVFNPQNSLNIYG